MKNDCMKGNLRLLPVLTAFTLFTLAGNGFSLTIKADGAVGGDPVVQWSLGLLDERLGELAGDRAGDAAMPAITLSIDEAASQTAGAEGFVIQTQPGQASIRAASSIGLRNGAVTFIEWVMSKTYANLENPSMIDIDFPVKRGQAAEFLANLPRHTIEEKPFFPTRSIQLSLLALGVADLIEPAQIEPKYNNYSGHPGGYKPTPELWKDWCDWAARHKLNNITNWPYSAGTNWWEMANDPATAGMSIYTPEEIDKAAVIREELFAYARSRGLCPMMFNYVAGAPTKTIVENYPELIGKKLVPSYPDPFAVASVELQNVFIAQIQAIFRQYPSLGGLHLRWWGESYPDANVENYWEVLRGLTLKIMEAAGEVRPDVKIILSGYLRCGGTSEYAASLPEYVTIQTKWGTDWEPTSHPNVPFDTIRDIARPLLISQNIPPEEFHSIGGVMYKPFQTGMMHYVDNIERMPNLQGFVTTLGEKDTTFVTVLNYMAAAKLNWDPKQTDVDALARNYLSLYYGAEAAGPLVEAFDTFQTVMEEYSHNYDGISRFFDCYRIHNAYGLDRIKDLYVIDILNLMPQVQRHADQMEAAYNQVIEARSLINGQPDLQFQDLDMMMHFWKLFFQSRMILAKAFIDRHMTDHEAMEDKLKQVIALDEEMLDLAMNKPNISDDFEMEGMGAAIQMPPSINSEISQILLLLQEHQANSDNMLLNGDFELTKRLPPYNWKVAAVGGSGFKAELEGKDTAGGRCAIKLVQPTAEGKDGLLATNNPISLAPGEKITVEFMIKDVPDISTSERVLFTIAHYDGERKIIGNLAARSIEPPRNGAYEQFQETVTMPEGGESIKFSFRITDAQGKLGPGDVLIDEVKVRQQ